MLAYYNEIDPKKAAWLQALQEADSISKGGVDTRSIADLATPTTLAGLGAVYEAHFFAGIGVWARALRQAGWPDGVRVWTGSCPCQSFSASGQRRGFSDQRHLWPAWFRLIRECRPDVLFGEQVASPDGLAWFDVVSTDLEGAGYTIGAVDSCAAGFGAPHIRQRLYFVAYAERRNACAERLQRSGQYGRGPQDGGAGVVADSGGPAAIARDGGSETGSVADTAGGRCEQRDAGLGPVQFADANGETGRLDDASSARSQGHAGDVDGARRVETTARSVAAPGALNGFWSDHEWIWCRDGKYRPAKPGIFPLAHGIAGRVGLLRGYGDCIVLPQAQAFIEVFMEEMSWRLHQR